MNLWHEDVYKRQSIYCTHKNRNRRKADEEATHLPRADSRRRADRLDRRHFLCLLYTSLAPTPAVGDSVAAILEEMGLEVCGAHGTTAALALLNDCLLYTSRCV